MIKENERVLVRIDGATDFSGAERGNEKEGGYGEIVRVLMREKK
ncbi:hypothetical protein COLO4_37858 [Corchorus olitorius]|uniref:Uncharacterized protein n=1 Tax=Corchorus olitorius TaxID=93759 RepID=A0A1R3FYQ1_9ROSI|nr:hypothetical protein COLO4_37858 [Corchorus olitorius]